MPSLKGHDIILQNAIFAFVTSFFSSTYVRFDGVWVMRSTAVPTVSADALESLVFVSVKSEEGKRDAYLKDLNGVASNDL